MILDQGVRSEDELYGGCRQRAPRHDDFRVRTDDRRNNPGVAKCDRVEQANMGNLNLRRTTKYGGWTPLYAGGLDKYWGSPPLFREPQHRLDLFRLDQHEWTTT